MFQQNGRRTRGDAVVGEGGLSRIHNPTPSHPLCSECDGGERGSKGGGEGWLPHEGLLREKRGEARRMEVDDDPRQPTPTTSHPPLCR